MKKTIQSLAIITLGCFLFAFTVNTFLISNKMGQGGISGLSMMLFYLTGIPMSLFYFLLNGILLIFGFKFLDKKTLLYTIYSIVITSLFLSTTTFWTYTFQDPILITVVVGVLVGISIGIILSAGGSTAGLDIIALILRKYFHIPTSVSLFSLDLFIIVPSLFIIGFEKMVYTLIMLAITTKTIDYILEGFNVKKSVTIISEHYEAIAEHISLHIPRGITILSGTGYYTKAQKHILFIVIGRNQLLKLTRIVNKIDPTAFMTISDVHSVLGEGFTFNKH
ncbi:MULTISPECIES: YitT family protein [unclassified Granulicatella]|uniref:YitT family protein n=1 Tax=unclassified Granulicatella TaxID=2630493 RepID=UPI001072F140|nr:MULTISPECIES: YitT family protein [unclassified Granulicatella]MBF0780550.1 YitT family protein [Granulicatella sp. 19428wC4_WM01]TFU94904.1 YitT family protein [Granulicatella sp. WM01]